MSQNELFINNLLSDKIIYNISPYASRSVSFFKKYPFAISIFLSNLYSPLHVIYDHLTANNIVTRNGTPISINYISYYRRFIKDILKYLNDVSFKETMLKNNLNEK